MKRKQCLVYVQCMAVLIPKSRQQPLVLDTLDFQKIHIKRMCGLICVVELISLILLTVKNNEEHIQSSPWRSSTRTKKNVKTLTSDIQLAGVNLPVDVVSFQAKISIFFMIRHLNKKITQAKQASSDSRSYARKKDENRDIKVTPYKDGLIKLYEEDYYYYFHYYCYYNYYNHGLISPT